MTPKFDFSVENLGECKIPSPIKLSNQYGDCRANYVKDTSFVRRSVNVYADSEPVADDSSNLMEKAGPREYIYFKPEEVHAGICTCGGLCPGLNDVIRAVVRCLWNRYGVRDIRGIRFGYKGFIPENGFEPVELTPDNVDTIHRIGGTILGTSRGGGNRTPEIVDSIVKMGINMLFVIGGDGTQHGGLSIANEIEKRGLKIAVVGIPKTVDNDFKFIDRSFGYETAVQKATQAVNSVHMEAHSQINGIGLVKLMGRESGFIAAGTALASHETNFCLIPEVPFELEGENGLLAHLEKRLENRGHAVIVVAEGAKDKEEAKMDKKTFKKHRADMKYSIAYRVAQELEEATGLESRVSVLGYLQRGGTPVAYDRILATQFGTAAADFLARGEFGKLVALQNGKIVGVPLQEIAGLVKNVPLSNPMLQAAKSIGVCFGD